MKFYTLLLLALFCTNTSEANTQPARVTTLTLSDFLERAKNNDIQIKQLFHQRLETTFLKPLTLPSSGVILDVTSQYGFALDDGGQTNVWRFNFEKPIPSTGTTLSASHNLNTQEDRDEEVTTFSVEQPLFRNTFGRKTRRQTRMLDKENLVIELQSAEAYEDYVASIISQYLDWQLTYMNYQLTRTLYDENLKLQKTIAARQQRGIAKQLDSDRITLETLQFEARMLDLESSLKDRVSEITSVIGYSSTDTWKPESITSIEFLAPKAIEIQERVLASRSLQALRLAEEAGALNVLVQKDDLNPALNFIAGFNRDKSTRFTTTTDRNEVFVGFNFNWPLWNSQNSAKVEKAVHEQIDSQLARDLFSRNLKTALVKQKEKLTLHGRRVNLNQKIWKLSERVVKQEQQRYERGQVDLETLILVRQNLADNQFSYQERQTDLNKEIVEWLRLNDKLIQKNQLRFGLATPIKN